MMNSDKERIVEEEDAAKIPRTEIYTKKIIHTTQKPWFLQCLGVFLGIMALILSLTALIAFMGWKYVPIRTPTDDLPIDTKDSDEYLMKQACYQPKDPGNCNAIEPRWYFDQELERCLQFEYGGCRGNENNFLTERECNHRCVRSEDDFIRLPEGERGINRNSGTPVPPSRTSPIDKDDFCLERPEPGTCRGSFERFYFDTKSGECHKFLYGGCDGNRNNFETKEECDVQCKSRLKGSLDDNPCNLESDTGPCRASIPRFFFNVQSGKCEMFVYGGCAGNDNNFETANDCERKCPSQDKDVDPVSPEPTERIF